MTLRNVLGRCEETIQGAITHPDACMPFLRAGRLLHIRVGAVDWGWGILLQVTYKAPKNEVTYDFSVLLGGYQQRRLLVFTAWLSLNSYQCFCFGVTSLTNVIDHFHGGVSPLVNERAEVFSQKNNNTARNLCHDIQAQQMQLQVCLD